MCSTHLQFLLVSGFPRVPLESFSDLEKREFEGGNVNEAFRRLSDQMACLFAHQDPRSAQIRQASRLFVQGVTSHDYGYAISLFFLALEALLLSDAKADVQARLTEAIVYSVGRSASGRDGLRKEIKRLYNIRSRFIHTGEVDTSWEDAGRCRDITQEVIRKEIKDFHDETPWPSSDSD